MNNRPPPISSCRHCRFYQPEGRRGGACQQLDVTVQANWQACNLAASPFDAPITRVDSAQFAEPFSLPLIKASSLPQAPVKVPH